MNIYNQSVNFLKPVHQKLNAAQTKKISFHSNINTDVFEKTTKPCNDYSYQAFKKWADKTNFSSKAVDIAEKSGRCLGKGFEGCVYEIPDCENWVLKSYNRTNFIRHSIDEPEFIELKDILPDYNIGQPVSIVRIPAGKNYSHQYWILKKQKGKTLGISININWYDKNLLNKSNVNQHINSLKLLANAPQSTYDKFVKDINHISSQGLYIDCDNANNFLFDESAQTINFVDINDKKDSTNQFAEALYAILDGEFGSHFNRSYEECPQKNEVQEMSKTIINKFCKALKENNFKFRDCGELYDILTSGFSNPNVDGENYDKYIEILKEYNLCE